MDTRVLFSCSVTFNACVALLRHLSSVPDRALKPSATATLIFCKQRINSAHYTVIPITQYHDNACLHVKRTHVRYKTNHILQLLTQAFNVVVVVIAVVVAVVLLGLCVRAV